jgi:hypothetical protein
LPIIWKSRRRSGRRPPKRTPRWPVLPIASRAAGGGSSDAVLLHVVVDDFARSYWVDGPETNAMRLHLDVMRAARDHHRRLRQIDLRAESGDAAMALMREHFPGYAYRGTWTR